jgi:hypothetical protein
MIFFVTETTWLQSTYVFIILEVQLFKTIVAETCLWVYKLFKNEI